MKGLATLRLLRALQSRLGPDERARPLVDAFDLVVGTSTGAILAAALVARRMTLDEVDRMYRNLGAAVFSSFTNGNGGGGGGSGGGGGGGSGVPQGADAVAAAIWGAPDAGEEAAATSDPSRSSTSPREVGDPPPTTNAKPPQPPPAPSGWRDNLVRAYHSSTRSMRVAVYGAKHDAALFELYLKHLCVFGAQGAPATALPGDAGDGGASVASGGKPSSAKPNASVNASNSPEDREADAKAAAACKDDENDHLTAPRSRYGESFFFSLKEVLRVFLSFFRRGNVHPFFLFPPSLEHRITSIG